MAGRDASNKNVTSSFSARVSNTDNVLPTLKEACPQTASKPGAPKRRLTTDAGSEIEQERGRPEASKRACVNNESSVTSQAVTLKESVSPSPPQPFPEPTPPPSPRLEASPPKCELLGDNAVKAQNEPAKAVDLSNQSTFTTHPKDEAKAPLVVEYTDKLFHEAAIRWLIETDQPLSALEHPLFKKMINVASRATEEGVRIPNQETTENALRKVSGKRKYNR